MTNARDFRRAHAPRVHISAPSPKHFLRIAPLTEDQMQSDVEALLANRVGDARAYFIAPIDKCYELVGTIRKHWKGLSGGEEVWREIDEFFTGLTNA